MPTSQDLVVEDMYFRIHPNLISGVDITPLDGKPVTFIGCEFHAECNDIKKRNTYNWIIQ